MTQQEKLALVTILGLLLAGAIMVLLFVNADALRELRAS